LGPARRLLRMTELPIDDPQYFWSRAKEARAMADQMTDPDTKQKMLGVAGTYELLAKRAEARLRGEKLFAQAPDLPLAS
jgi:hypothetical protein